MFKRKTEKSIHSLFVSEILHPTRKYSYECKFLDILNNGIDKVDDLNLTIFVVYLQTESIESWTALIARLRILRFGPTGSQNQPSE